MHFIELNKFKKDFKDVKTTLDRWIVFLNRAYELEKDKVPEELAVDEAIKKAVEKLDIMYLSEQERAEYEDGLKRHRDYVATMEIAEIRGMEKGTEKGIEQVVILSRQEDILENLGGFDIVTDEIIKMVNEESDIETLKKWVKVSARVDSLEEFVEIIKNV